MCSLLQGKMKQKQWIHNVVCNTTDEGEEQNAIHEGVMMGKILLSYECMETDVQLCLSKLKELVEWYENNKAKNLAMLSQIYHQQFNVDLVK